MGGDQLELSTFILPLVDNSIYNGLRMILADESDGATLSVPIVEPAPVVQFSANLNDVAWQQIAGGFSEFFTRYSGASSAMLDDFWAQCARRCFRCGPNHRDRQWETSLARLVATCYEAAAMKC